MKIATNNIEAFIKNPDKKIRAALIYGPDSGLVNQRKKSLISAILKDPDDPFCFAEISYNNIKSDPAMFSDEINALGLTSDRRLVLIYDCQPSLNKTIGTSLVESKNDSFVVFTAGELPPSSSLRKIFEKEKNFASIACYKDEQYNIKSIIENKLKQEGFTFDYNVCTSLTNRFFGNRMIILNELDKLITYMGDNKNITSDDAEELIGDNKEITLDQICNDAASQNSQKIEANLKKALLDGVQPIAIIRSLLRYFMQLHMIKSKINSGINEAQALSSIRPPLFYKQVPVFKKHLSQWPIDRLNKAIDALINLELACKTTGNPAELLCSRFITIFPIAIKANR